MKVVMTFEADPSSESDYDKDSLFEEMLTAAADQLRLHGFRIILQAYSTEGIETTIPSGKRYCLACASS